MSGLKYLEALQKLPAPFTVIEAIEACGLTRARMLGTLMEYVRRGAAKRVGTRGRERLYQLCEVEPSSPKTKTSAPKTSQRQRGSYIRTLCAHKKPFTVAEAAKICAAAPRTIARTITFNITAGNLRRCGSRGRHAIYEAVVDVENITPTGRTPHAKQTQRTKRARAEHAPHVRAPREDVDGEARVRALASTPSRVVAMSERIGELRAELSALIQARDELLGHELVS